MATSPSDAARWNRYRDVMGRPSEPTPAALTIERIETIPIRVPLARVYRGSHYRMTHRSTIVTRVHTREGIVGEAYAGDEDAGLLDDRRDRAATRSRRGWSARTRSRSSAAGSSRARRRSTSCATAGSASSPARASTPPSGTRSARRSASRCGGSGAATATQLPMIAIGGYYDSPVSIADEVEDVRARGLAGMKFKVGGRAPEEDAARFRAARAAAGPDFVLAADANQALDAARRRSASRGSSRTATCAGSRSRAAGTTTAARCATCALDGRACACARARASSRPAAAAT